MMYKSKLYKNRLQSREVYKDYAAEYPILLSSATRVLRSVIRDHEDLECRKPLSKRSWKHRDICHKQWQKHKQSKRRFKDFKRVIDVEYLYDDSDIA